MKSKELRTLFLALIIGALYLTLSCAADARERAAGPAATAAVETGQYREARLRLHRYYRTHRHWGYPSRLRPWGLRRYEAPYWRHPHWGRPYSNFGYMGRRWSPGFVYPGYRWKPRHLRPWGFYYYLPDP